MNAAGDVGAVEALAVGSAEAVGAPEGQWRLGVQQKCRKICRFSTGAVEPVGATEWQQNL